MRHVIRSFALAAMAGAIGLFTAAEAQAQQPTQQQQIEVDEATLETFVKAYIEVREIGQELEPKIQNASSNEEAQQLQQQARERMQAAVQEQDMTVQRYTRIATALNADAELRQRFTEKLQELQSEQGGPGV